MIARACLNIGKCGLPEWLRTFPASVDPLCHSKPFTRRVSSPPPPPG
jgi:hypothetical protein